MDIGNKIKTLRKENGMTQEQLAELLHISAAAVSKWETGDSYPDILLLIPLARVFGVSLDVLMGYNEAELELEITQLLENCRNLDRNGKYDELTRLLADARAKYPNDYRIMDRYMWNLAGGMADNDSECLLSHEEEFRSICACILEGCNDEKIRLNALNMQAKLFHVHGDTEKALKILSDFPNGAHCSEQKIEQLYAKNTLEFRSQLTRNVYRYAHVYANKLMKKIRISSEEGCSVLEKSETLADRFLSLYHDTEEASFLLMAQMSYGCIAGSLSYDRADLGDILRVRDKELMCCKILSEVAKTDTIMEELLIKTYGTTDFSGWLISYLSTSQQGVLAALRESEMYRSHFANSSESE